MTFVAAIGPVRQIAAQLEYDELESTWYSCVSWRIDYNLGSLVDSTSL